MGISKKILVDLAAVSLDVRQFFHRFQMNPLIIDTKYQYIFSELAYLFIYSIGLGLKVDLQININDYYS